MTAVLVVALASLAASPATDAAAEDGPASAWAKTEQTAVRLIAATTAVGQRETLPLGLEFKLDPGWKIYWRSPGDAGFPPRPDWSASENVRSATLRWPAPERFSVLGIETLGYKDAVVLPLDVVPATPGEPVRLRGKVDYLTCDEICIPYTAELALDLPAGDAEPSAFTHLIDRYADRVPGDGSAHGLKIESVTAPGGAAAKSLRVVATSVVPFEAPDIFVEGPVDLIFDKPTFVFADGGMRATATIGVDGVKFLEKDLTETALTVTLADGPRSAEKTVTPAAETGSPSTPVSLSIASVLGLALLGGLILNLMRA
jgi:suppressor for copper-sensitivity B